MATDQPKAAERHRIRVDGGGDSEEPPHHPARFVGPLSERRALAAGRHRPQRAPAEEPRRRSEPHRRVLPEERRQRKSARRGSLADRRARRDRAAAPAFVRSLPGFSAGPRSASSSCRCCRASRTSKGCCARSCRAPIPKSVKTDNLMNKAMSLFEKLVESDSKYSNELLNILRMNMSEGPDTFADLLSSFVNFPLEEKQLLLETVNPIERLELLIDWIQRDLGKATFDKELQRQIQTSIDRRERETLSSRTASRHSGRARRHEQLRARSRHVSRPRRSASARRGAQTDAAARGESVRTTLAVIERLRRHQRPSRHRLSDSVGGEDRGPARPRARRGDSRRAASRTGEGQRARAGVSGRAQTQGRSERSDPLLRRTARRRQDLARRRDRRRPRTQVRAHGRRRRHRRIGDPRTSQDVHRRDARED